MNLTATSGLAGVDSVAVDGEDTPHTCGKAAESTYFGVERSRRIARQSDMRRPTSTLLLLPAVMTLALAMGGCGDVGSTTATGATTLDGEWRLVSSSLSSVEPSMLGTAPVTMTVDGSTVVGRAACNNYSFNLDTDGATLHFTGLGATDMACAPDVMTLESSYLAALSQVNTATRGADVLTLAGAGVELSYEPVSAPSDRPFTGTSWELESLISGSGPDDTVSSTATAADLRFDDDGTFTGATGCGRIVGDWERVDDRVAMTFGDPPRPPGDIRPAPCYPDATAQLNQLMAVLDESFTTTISGDVLTLTASDGFGLSYRAQPADAADSPAVDPAADPAIDPAKGVSSDPIKNPSAAADIDGRWLLREGSTDGGSIEAEGRPLTMSLEDGQGTVNGGCSVTAARVGGEASDIQFWLGPSTAPRCDSDAMAVQSAYIAALLAVTTYERTADLLVLAGGGAELSFELLPTDS